MNINVWGQYAIATVAMISLVAINIWGVDNETINTALIGAIAATTWGGVQRGKDPK